MIPGQSKSKERLPDAVWKRSVLKQIHHRQKDMLPMSSGKVYGRLFSEKSQGYALISAPIERERGLLPLLRRVLAAGCEPIGITATLLLPEGTPEQTLRRTVSALDQECKEYDLELLQVEPCVSSAAHEILLQATVVGKESCLDLRDWQTAVSGQNIVMTGWAGMEGTQKLLREKQEAALRRFPLHFIEKTKQYEEKRLPKLEQRLALEYGATAMYAAGESGMMDALWQLGESVGKGMEISLYQLPIRQETIELADFFNENPYQIASGGVFLIVTERGRELAERLQQERLPAEVIGTIREDRDRVVCFHEERRFLEPYR